jgi:hypothetical protein
MVRNFLVPAIQALALFVFRNKDLLRADSAFSRGHFE